MKLTINFDLTECDITLILHRCWLGESQNGRERLLRNWELSTENALRDIKTSIHWFGKATDSSQASKDSMVCGRINDIAKRIMGRPVQLKPITDPWADMLAEALECTPDALIDGIHKGQGIVRKACAVATAIRFGRDRLCHELEDPDVAIALEDESHPRHSHYIGYMAIVAGWLKREEAQRQAERELELQQTDKVLSIISDRIKLIGEDVCIAASKGANLSINSKTGNVTLA